ncbi:MAG: hypothetical protein PHH30_05955 [Bacteroidales bacterium]|nr:hypothetical protein [Bacteroidales bacterium]MDD3858860.1 hypothetical protein [Bacteroidales bacterium]
MKKIIFIIFLITGSFLASAQVGDFEENSDGGGFGSIMVSFRTLDGRMAVYSGGGGGFIVKDFRIGVFFNGLTNSFSNNDTLNITYKLGCSYGGIWLGYPFFKDNALHGLAEMKFSIGNTRLINVNWIQIDNGMFYGFTPSLAMEYNVTDVFRISAGVEYHYSLFPEPPVYYTASSFCSPGIFVSLKLGTF